MSRTVCLVTGLQLEVRSAGLEPIYYWGDLHLHPSGALIFNAVCENGRAAPQEPRGSAWRSIFCPVDSVWERRGVFVLDRKSCTFNTPLRRFLEESPHAL